MAFISIIIPAYNESKRIIPTLQRLFSFIGSSKDRFEVILVDDGSTDGTSESVQGHFASRVSLRVIKNAQNHGKGCSVRQGMLASQGELCLFMDADLSTPIEEIAKLLTYIRLGFDVVIGSRAISSEEIEVRKTLHRFIMGRVFSVLVRILVVPGIKDTQCGFKMFTRQAVQEIFNRQKLDGFSFDVEVLYIARMLGLKIKEVPVNWSESESSKVKLFSDSIDMTKDLFKIRGLHKGRL